ncbi:MAG: lysophospholipid acyltransferase family protein [Akkermansiaceae bacterium]
MSRSARITIPHRLEYGALRFVETALRCLPLPFVFKLGGFFGAILHSCWGKQRKLVNRSITQAFGDQKSPEEIAELTQLSFRRTAGNFFISFVMPFYSVEEIKRHAEVKGLELFNRALEEKRGIIFLVPHMGNWELLAQLVGLFDSDFQVATHYRPLNNPLVNRLVEERRKAKGLQLFPKRTSSHKLCAFLREGHVLSILADQRLASKGDLCAFFGRPTACSPLPSLLAKRTEAILLGLHCRTLSNGQWELSVTEVVGTDSQACAANLEQAWRSSPADVFWFQNRWKLLKQAPLRPLTRKPFPPAESITKPVRLQLGASLSEKPDLPFPDYLVEWVELDADLVVEQEHLDQINP